MPAKTAPYYVLLDANIWVAERLLQSSIGSALLYALTGAGASLLLPEVVELEVNRVLPDLAERAVSVIARESSLLRQLSGHKLLFTGPTPLAIEEGISRRWKELDGLLKRIPFSHEQARAALQRVIKKSPPSGDNNEQYRDCCIWDAGLAASHDCTVHLVTGDAAFYEGRNRSAGLAASLAAELKAAGMEIQIYPSLRDFLSGLEGATAAIDDAAIGSTIVQAVTPLARGFASERGHFELGAARRTRIHGYATPKPTLIAVSFEVSFDLQRVAPGDEERLGKASLGLKGVCSFDPNLKEISEIEIRERSESLDYPSGGFQGSVKPDPEEQRQYLPTHMRVISK